MNNNKFSRRDFIRNASLVAAGTVAGSLSSSEKGMAQEVSKAKILNRNEKMSYRRLGKTGLIVSEISLGGHWKNRNAGPYWAKFSNDEVPDDVAKNRTEVVSACIDAGMNYLDITTGAECLSYGVALKGRRKKMIIGADDGRLCIRKAELCNVKAQTNNVDTCLRYLQTDYLDIWRPQAIQDGSTTDEQFEPCLEVFQKMHKEGKILHLGISAHNRPYLDHIIDKYSEIEMVIFPCSAKTKEKGLSPTPENVEEVNAIKWSDETQSIFKKAREKDIGIVTIKPFFGGSLFANDKNAKFPVMGVGSKDENDLARLTLQCILAKENITSIVPGMTTVYHAENAARASYTRPMGMSAAEQEWLMAVTEESWANLPQEYAWLRDWEYV